MKASELRIGNLVNRLGKTDIVQSVTINSDGFGYVATKSSGAITQNQVEPIPLTEEWLVKFGFERNDNKSFSDSFYSIMVGGSTMNINPDNGVVWIVRNDNIFNNPTLIQFVHQLQNLYFALTGEELTIK